MEKLTVKEIEKRGFIQGYFCAVANLIRTRDMPVISGELFKEYGGMTESELRKAKVPREDILLFRKHKLL